ncbi:SCY1-like protein 2 isoform X2 [Lepisosteus oculatus]|uniref:SCY1-like protein 2 isoform X2 n=1 Tax=Lepisosteus oculatus TaxID=7918 RepID=UPI00371EFB50
MASVPCGGSGMAEKPPSPDCVNRVRVFSAGLGSGSVRTVVRGGGAPAFLTPFQENGPSRLDLRLVSQAELPSTGASRDGLASGVWTPPSRTGMSPQRFRSRSELGQPALWRPGSGDRSPVLRSAGWGDTPGAAMESMLNKLKSTVTKVTADVTSAVMGNPVTREFEVGRHIASGGPGLSWRVYNGTKKSTKQEVAVFVFDKKIIDKYQKFEKDQIIDSLKRGVQQLTRLRHPRLLTVQHPLEESRDCLAFCTEPVFASLSNVLGQWDNLPTPVPADIKEYKLYDVETKYGLLQISEGLSFLHSGVKMVHGNLTPENIILNKSGAWKIMGFDFSISSSNPSEQEAKYSCKEWDPNLPSLCLPNPEYLAPEYILSVSCDSASDMYSLGVVIHAVFDEGKPIFEVNKHDIFKSFSRQLDQKSQLSRLNPSVLARIPEEVREHTKMLLNVTPTVRPDADQMTKIPFFDDVGAMTLQYFDTLFQRDNLQKSQFYKGLPKILPKLPKRVVVHRVLPALTSEFVNPDMVPFVLPNVLLIAEQCTKEEYVRLILPELSPVFRQQEPVQILLIFLQKMDLLLTKTPPDDIKNNVLPMVYRALEAPSIQIQELCLNIIPTFANLIDYPSMKNSLIPRIKTACLQTSSLAVRVNSLVCLGKILEYLDKWYVIDEILPFLQQIPSREPAVLMGVLGIYKCTFSHKKLGIPKEQLAGKTLPHLIPLSIDGNLNLNQFNSFMAVIKDMLSRMETEHKTKLEQLHVMQEQQRGLDISSQLNKPEEPKTSPGNQMDKIFGADTGSTSSDGKDSRPAASAAPPSRVSLTLEEKQRLAKEQEQAEKLRNQLPLAPRNVKPTASVKQAKDLTSTLLDNVSSLGNLSLSSAKPAAPQGLGPGFSSASPMGSLSSAGAVSNGFSSGGGFPSSGLARGLPPAQNVYGGMASTASTPGFGSLAGLGQPGAVGPSRPTDMSALDSLFGSQKPKVSLNQMATKPAPVTAAPSPWLHQFVGPQAPQNMSAPLGAAPPGMLGQGGFSMQANPFYSPQNFPQPGVPSAPGSTMKTSASASNDLKDLFG